MIVRDPRDVAPSLANHNRVQHRQRDRADEQSPTPSTAPSRGGCDQQLRQQLPGWSGHIASWLDQTDIPVHLIRYEDMQADTVGTFRRALDFAGRPASDDDIRRAVGYADFDELRRQEEDKGFSETPRRPDGQFFRRGEAGAWRDELTRRAGGADRSRACADDAAAGL